MAWQNDYLCFVTQPNLTDCVYLTHDVAFFRLPKGLKIQLPVGSIFSFPKVVQYKTGCNLVLFSHKINMPTGYNPRWAIAGFPDGSNRLSPYFSNRIMVTGVGEVEANGLKQYHQTHFANFSTRDDFSNPSKGFLAIIAMDQQEGKRGGIRK